MTRTTIPEIRRDAEFTRKRGFSLDDEESYLGIRSLAAPVYASNASVAAAIGISAHSVRFSSERIMEMAGHVKSAAGELARLLGFFPRADANSTSNRFTPEELSNQARHPSDSGL